MATYLVTRKDAPEGEKPRMVEARLKSQAINHVCNDMFEATPLSTREALSWAGQGVALEDLSGDAESSEEAEG